MTTVLSRQTVTEGKNAKDPYVDVPDGYEWAGWLGNFENVEQDEKVYASYTCITCVNGYQYVDLGLSVNWATCNVGAAIPTDYGNYYAWGETEPKSSYSWSNYKYCEGSSTTLTKYNFSSSNGTVDSISVLLPEDDAATVNLGNGWRTPTETEILELRDNCTFTPVSNYLNSGVRGVLVTSNIDGYKTKSIFLPEGGWYGTRLSFKGSDGEFWSGNIQPANCLHPSSLSVSSSGVEWSFSERCYGHNIRAVADK